MRDRRAAAPFDDIAEGIEVVAYVQSRFDERIAHPGLRGEMHDVIEAPVVEEAQGRGSIRQVDPFERESRAVRELCHTRFLEPHVVVRLEAVDAGHLRARVEQRASRMHADESRDAGDEDAPSREIRWCHRPPRASSASARNFAYLRKLANAPI